MTTEAPDERVNLGGRLNSRVKIDQCHQVNNARNGLYQLNISFVKDFEGSSVFEEFINKCKTK